MIREEGAAGRWHRLAGLSVVNPNEANVLTLVGRYVGSVKVTGLGG